MKNIICLSNVSKKYKNNIIFDNLNFSCSKGKIVGITGPNGSGKSVLFKIIAGLIKPDHGEVIVNGKNISSSGTIPPNVGALIEEPGFMESYSGLDNLKFLASIKNVITEEDIIRTLKIVDLIKVKDAKVKTYSLGMKKKLGIAQALMEYPEILLLDEPMNALDKNSIISTRKVLNELKENGTTILIVSHNDNDIELLCDDTYSIDNYTLTKK